MNFTHSAFNERIQEVLLEHPKFTPPAKTEKVKLVQRTLEDVGLSNPGAFTELTRRAATEGLKLCPLYLAAYLRLAYLDQPEGPSLTIASEKPEQDENDPNGFYIRNFEKTL